MDRSGKPVAKSQGVIEEPDEVEYDQHGLRGMEKRLEELEGKVSRLQVKINCVHEPICLPSRHGPVPIFPVQIADERKMNVIAPGKRPPVVFAIALCCKCGLPYVHTNKLEEAAPFEGGDPPPTPVKPGEPVGGLGGIL